MVLVSWKRPAVLEAFAKGMTYQEIGEWFGFSRQRAQQLTRPPLAIRRNVLERAKGLCEKCDVVAGDSGHIHHITTDGKQTDADNFRLLCNSCHISLHSIDNHITSKLRTIARNVLAKEGVLYPDGNQLRIAVLLVEAGTRLTRGR